MGTLIDAAEWTDNEIYEMLQTDGCEAAAIGASFGGLGINNQPHQQLANRTAYLKGRQDTNIASIAALAAFTAKFASLLTPNGYIKIPVQDVSLGASVAIIQWGADFPSTELLNDTAYIINWPTPYPNACLWALASLANSTADYLTGKLLMETVGYTTTQGTFFSTFIGGSDASQHKNNGFYWVSIGY